MKEAEVRELLEEIDRKAEAGLCYFTLGSAREFLKDIRTVVAEALAAPASVDVPRHDGTISRYDLSPAMVEGTGKPVRVFGLTASGDPKHPLMLRYDTPLVDWPA